jgi:hypothetical protein
MTVVWSFLVIAFLVDGRRLAVGDGRFDLADRPASATNAEPSRRAERPLGAELNSTR